MNKSDLRTLFKKQRNNLTKEQISLKSQSISTMLFSLSDYINANIVLIYVSCKNEVDTFRIIEKCFEDKKKVAVPKIIKNEMYFFYIDNIGQLAPGYFGILEPTTMAKYMYNEVTRASSQLLLMPGLVFDIKKNRLGYGGGFYDRFLQKNNIDNKIALAYDFQVISKQLPCDDYDIKPDKIITESKFY